MGNAMMHPHPDSALFAPIIFSVKVAHHVVTLPDKCGELWAADVKAVRPGHLYKLFAEILFVESRNNAYVLGIEHQDGRPTKLPKHLANKQQEFVLFLREQTNEEAKALGLLAKFFYWHQYLCEAAATASYVVARDAPLNIGIGYKNESGSYDLIAVDQTDELINNARLTVPFDELTGTQGFACESHRAQSH